ncbi:MAG: Mdm33 family-domain-containing protein [Monoraphidium minutum]|nr:MAG: Mdm33 family-domain-containing protein [Monoraphidium minutum]
MMKTHAVLLALAALLGAACAATTYPTVKAAIQALPELSAISTNLQGTALATEFADPALVATVFLPTNKALEVLIEQVGGDWQSLMADNPEQANSVFSYNVVPGKALLTSGLVNGATLATSNGETLAITVEGGVARVNGHRILKGNIVAGRAIVHVVDGVLLPPDLVEMLGATTSTGDDPFGEFVEGGDNADGATPTTTTTTTTTTPGAGATPADTTAAPTTNTGTGTTPPATKDGAAAAAFGAAALALPPLVALLLISGGGDGGSNGDDPGVKQKLKSAWQIATAKDGGGGGAVPGTAVAAAKGGAAAGAGSEAAVARAARALNLLTGYDSVERLKAEVEGSDARLAGLRRQLQTAKQAYDAGLERQRGLSKEMALLLQRKSSWGPSDVARFTDVYASEHANEAEVTAAKAGYEEAGAAVEAAQADLMQKIRERYTQEQLWSDKIRRAATWWTWSLMGLQAASFVAVYAIMEPRRRERLQFAIGELVTEQGVALQRRLDALGGGGAATSSGGGSGGGGGSGLAGAAAAAAAEGGRLAQGQGREQRQQQQQQEEQQKQKQDAVLAEVLGELRRVRAALDASAPGPGSAAAAVAASAAGAAAASQDRERQQCAGAPRGKARAMGAAERRFWRAVGPLQRLWSRAVGVALRRCPDRVTLSREQAAGLAAASAAAGGAAALLAAALLGAAGRGGGAGGGAGGASGGSCGAGTAAGG